jgi:ATP-dependent 26S proteasome regulatory subunit
MFVASRIMQRNVIANKSARKLLINKLQATVFIKRSISLSMISIQNGNKSLPVKHQTNHLQLRLLHSSPCLRWTTPDELPTSELRRECDRRSISTKGSRSALIQRLKANLVELGGHDNGLTIDTNLSLKKKQIESEVNRIPEKHHTTQYIFVEERFQKKIQSQFNDSRIKLHNDLPSHIRIDGKYADVCSLRAQITDAVCLIASQETIYSLPHAVVLRLKRSILADIRRSHDVNFTIMRHKHNGEDMMLVAVEGETQNRIQACQVLEDVIHKIKTHSTDIPGMESYSNPNLSPTDSLPSKLNLSPTTLLSRLEDASSTSNNLRDSVSDCFNIFSGVVLYMDPRMREMMQDYQSRLDTIATENNCNIYLGNRDMFWLNDFQIAIESSVKADVSNARLEIDSLMNHLKSLTMTLVLPPAINSDMQKESKQLANAIQKQLGVDTVIIQQNDHIYVHLIGTREQVNSAACVIDSRTHKLHKLRGSDRDRLLRRERIRTLKFFDYGVGGLDDTLRDMLRRTFESRLISPRLRSELALQHVRGVLLYGPPGTGKTLIARKIAGILGCDKPKIVNGPEVESKWVGEAEKNIRGLFEEAEAEFEEKGEESDLHVVIFDEIDAIAKKRGGAHAKSRDGALNQLLCCMDGIDALDNILVFGLTNRKDCLDAALLRPGRLEVQLDIGLPDAKGREDILLIHTETMRKNGRLHPEVDLQVLAEMADEFSGADIAGMIRSAVSFSLDDMEDEDEVVITQEMLQRGLHEVRFARERLPTDEDPEANYPGLLQA